MTAPSPSVSSPSATCPRAAGRRPTSPPSSSRPRWSRPPPAARRRQSFSQCLARAAARVTTNKITILLIAAALVGGILYLGSAANRELKRSRDLIDKQNERLAQMQGVFEQQQERQHELDKTNQGIINTLSLAPQIRSAYGGGVGLLTGSYILVERGTGRQLRYPEPAQPSTDPAAPAGAEEAQPVLTPEGYGEPYEEGVCGHGLPRRRRLRHHEPPLAVEPWRADQSAQVIGASVNVSSASRASLSTSPGVTQPFPLRCKSTSARDDLAVCLIEGRELPKKSPHSR